MLDNLNAIARPKDYLVLDLQPGLGTDARGDHGKRSGAAGEIPKPTARWLEGPIRRSCPDVREIHMTCRLDPAPIQGSYTLTVLATVRSQSQGERVFSMFRFRRHDRACLCRRCPTWAGSWWRVRRCRLSKVGPRQCCGFGVAEQVRERRAWSRRG